MIVRAATRADSAIIFAFIRELAEYEKLSHAVDATEEGIADALFGEAPRVFCDIVERHNEPVGFALWFYNFSTFRGKHGIYLEDLFVRPEFRGRGFGKALLVHLARICMDQGYGRLQWWVLDWNTPAIDFYKSIGAEAMDEWTVFRVSGKALADLADS